MPKLKTDRVPSYRLHKQSGQGIVTLSGKDHLLGKHNTEKSRGTYDRLIAEWLANGRRTKSRGDRVTVSRVIADFWAHAKAYYVNSDGQPTEEADNFRVAMIPLCRLYGGTPAEDFGPLALQAIQQELIRLGGCRTYVNRQVSRIRQVFKWAASQELVPVAAHAALTTVAGLRKGKSHARESAPVRPVAEEHVEATLARVSKQVATIARLQLMTGMRPGEAVIMRGCDIDTGGGPPVNQAKQIALVPGAHKAVQQELTRVGVWIYTPQYHKTEHHDIGRQIRIGPKAQEIIRPFLVADLQAYLFRPEDAERARRDVLRGKRVNGKGAPLSCGNGPGTNVVKVRKLKRRPRYTSNTYRQAIARACILAFPPPAQLARAKVKGGKGERWETPAEWRARLGEEAWGELQAWISSHHWHPNQLRHTAATRLRREFGIDVAQGILGHRLGSNITEVYAEIDAQKLNAIVGRIG